mmetsp:Transcript_13200/g.31019  ORF Transcript_13200/g.31019 Transcript_13200/m.31019 type:complete len:203 (+) Transcript_13200:47-655(+)
MADAHVDVAGAEADLEALPDISGLPEIAFQDCDGFYDEVQQAVTTGAPFCLRLPPADALPPRLRTLLQVPEHAAVAQFVVKLDRCFRPPVLDHWEEWDSQDARARAAQPMAQLAPVLVAGRISAHCLFGMRYGLAWSRAQDWRRWRWVLALAATGAAGGAAAGLGAGAVLGGAAGAAAGVVSTGSRSAEVTLGRESVVVACR